MLNTETIVTKKKGKKKWELEAKQVNVSNKMQGQEAIIIKLIFL